jgi:hypothetical protein
MYTVVWGLLFEKIKGGVEICLIVFRNKVGCTKTKIRGDVKGSVA